MKRIFLIVGMLAGLSIVVASAIQSQSVRTKQAPSDSPKEDKVTGSRAADEAAIRANIAEFVRAYNTGDAKAVAALFVPEGHIMDKEGNTAEGRDAIRATFAKLFAAAPKKRLELTVDSLRFIGPDLAMETGTTKETFAPGEAPEQDQYTVLHTKRDGKWLMAMARDTEGDLPTAQERLKPLGWLVGEWIEDGGAVVVRSSCQWSKDGKFLLQEFQVKAEGKETMHASQRIGWDPQTGRIRSWVFDSEGGFGESVWTRNGNHWVIKATGVRPDGTNASATNVLVPTGTDGYVWRSTDRIVGDEVAPAIEVKVVRKPPQPKR